MNAITPPIPAMALAFHSTGDVAPSACPGDLKTFLRNVANKNSEFCIRSPVDKFSSASVCSSVNGEASVSSGRVCSSALNFLSPEHGISTGLTSHSLQGKVGSYVPVDVTPSLGTELLCATLPDRPFVCGISVVARENCSGSRLGDRALTKEYVTPCSQRLNKETRDASTTLAEAKETEDGATPASVVTPVEILTPVNIGVAIISPQDEVLKPDDSSLKNDVNCPRGVFDEDVGAENAVVTSGDGEDPSSLELSAVCVENETACLAAEWSVVPVSEECICEAEDQSLCLVDKDMCHIDSICDMTLPVGCFKETYVSALAKSTASVYSESSQVLSTNAGDTTTQGSVASTKSGITKNCSQSSLTPLPMRMLSSFHPRAHRAIWNMSGLPLQEPDAAVTLADMVSGIPQEIGEAEGEVVGPRSGAHVEDPSSSGLRHTRGRSIRSHARIRTNNLRPDAGDWGRSRGSLMNRPHKRYRGERRHRSQTTQKLTSDVLVQFEASTTTPDLMSSAHAAAPELSPPLVVTGDSTDVNQPAPSNSLDFFWLVKERASRIRSRAFADMNNANGDEARVTAFAKAERQAQRGDDTSVSQQSSEESTKGTVNHRCRDETSLVNMCENPSDLWFGLTTKDGKPVVLHSRPAPRRRDRHRRAAEGMCVQTRQTQLNAQEGGGGSRSRKHRYRNNYTNAPSATQTSHGHQQQMNIPNNHYSQTPNYNGIHHHAAHGHGLSTHTHLPFPAGTSSRVSWEAFGPRRSGFVEFGQEGDGKDIRMGDRLRRDRHRRQHKRAHSSRSKPLLANGNGPGGICYSPSMDVPLFSEGKRSDRRRRHVKKTNVEAGSLTTSSSRLVFVEAPGGSTGSGPTHMTKEGSASNNGVSLDVPSHQRSKRPRLRSRVEDSSSTCADPFLAFKPPAPIFFGPRRGGHQVNRRSSANPFRRSNDCNNCKTGNGISGIGCDDSTVPNVSGGSARGPAPNQWSSGGVRFQYFRGTLVGASTGPTCARVKGFESATDGSARGGGFQRHLPTYGDLDVKASHVPSNLSESSLHDSVRISAEPRGEEVVGRAQNPQPFAQSTQAYSHNSSHPYAQMGQQFVGTERARPQRISARERVQWQLARSRGLLGPYDGSNA